MLRIRNKKKEKISSVSECCVCSTRYLYNCRLYVLYSDEDKTHIVYIVSIPKVL